MHYIEVDQQADALVREFQIGKHLSFVNLKNTFDDS